jgi:hypothetical protein
VAVALFTRITDELDTSLRDSSFPPLARYYLLDMEDNHTMVMVNHGTILQNILVDSKRANLGILIAVGLPKMIDMIARAKRPLTPDGAAFQALPIQGQSRPLSPPQSHRARRGSSGPWTREWQSAPVGVSVITRAFRRGGDVGPPHSTRSRPPRARLAEAQRRELEASARR